MIWAVGHVLKNDRYTIEAVLGHGRLSVTYRARAKNNDRQVLKVPNDEATQADFDRVQARFVKEAFKLQQCQHPNIVKVFEPFQEDGLWCIPMEYIAGTTLEDRDRRQLSEPEAITYVTQVGEALGVLHGQTLIHRDVQPGNVMIRVRDGVSEAVLIDFGLVKDFSMQSGPSSVTTTTQDAGMHPGYKAPELYVRDGSRGAFCDLYALGALLYELVTGDAPPYAIERQLQPRPLSFPGSAVSDRVKLAIEDAMAIEVLARPKTVSEWLEELKPETNSETKPETKMARPEQAKPNLMNWKMMLKVLGAITALIAAITGLVQAFQPKDASPAKSEQSR